MNDLKNDGRQHQRFEDQKQISFYYNYDFETDVKFQGEKERRHIPPIKYSGVSKNVSAEGLCFTSHKEMEKGSEISMEVFLLDEKDPVHLEGQVCWSQLISTDKDEDALFNTGVKLNTVEGKSVHDTIYYDENYHLIWSDVLESILGSFRILAQERKKNNQNPSSS